jgi:hypothetical protein
MQGSGKTRQTFAPRREAKDFALAFACCSPERKLRITNGADWPDSAVQEPERKGAAHQRQGTTADRGFCFRENSVLQEERLVSALEFRDYGTLIWAIFMNHRPKLYNPDGSSGQPNP